MEKNENIKEFVVSTVKERKQNDTTVAGILKVMEEKYARKMGEKYMTLLKDIAEFKIDDGIERARNNKFKESTADALK